MAKIAHHRITPKVVQEIRSLAKETATKKRQLRSLYVLPETERWLTILAQKFGVRKGEIIHYFIEKELNTAFRFDTEKYEALLRVRAQRPNSLVMLSLYLPGFDNNHLPSETLEGIIRRAESQNITSAQLLSLVLIRSIKE